MALGRDGAAVGDAVEPAADGTLVAFAVNGGAPSFAARHATMNTSCVMSRACSASPTRPRTKPRNACCSRRSVASNAVRVAGLSGADHSVIHLPEEAGGAGGTPLSRYANWDRIDESHEPRARGQGRVKHGVV